MSSVIRWFLTASDCWNHILSSNLVLVVVEAVVVLAETKVVDGSLARVEHIFDIVLLQGPFQVYVISLNVVRSNQSVEPCRLRCFTSLLPVSRTRLV